MEMTKEKVLKMVENSVNDIFIHCQKIGHIHNGEIAPMQALKLDELQESLAERIFSILNEQIVPLDMDTVQKVIVAFKDRYMPYHKEKGEFTTITAKAGYVEFNFNNSYSIFAYLAPDGALMLENVYGDSLFDYASIYEWSEEDIKNIKYGK